MSKRVRLDLTDHIGKAEAKRLLRAGVADLGSLLRIACTPDGRTQLAKHSGLPEERILGWAHFADLCRVEGIGPQYATLLQGAGVTTLLALAAADPRELTAALRRLSGERGAPARDAIEDWIRAARSMRPAVREASPPTGVAWDEIPERTGLGRGRGRRRGLCEAGT